MTVTVAGQVWGRRGCWRPLGLVLLSCTHAISAFQAFTCYCCLLTKSCLTLATPWNVAYRAPLSMGFPRREYWSVWPLPSSVDLPDLSFSRDPGRGGDRENKISVPDREGDLTIQLAAGAFQQEVAR